MSVNPQKDPQSGGDEDRSGDGAGLLDQRCQEQSRREGLVTDGDRRSGETLSLPEPFYLLDGSSSVRASLPDLIDLPPFLAFLPSVPFLSWALGVG